MPSREGANSMPTGAIAAICEASWPPRLGIDAALAPTCRAPASSDDVLVCDHRRQLRPRRDRHGDAALCSSTGHIRGDPLQGKLDALVVERAKLEGELDPARHDVRRVRLHEHPADRADQRAVGLARLPFHREHQRRRGRKRIAPLVDRRSSGV